MHDHGDRAAGAARAWYAGPAAVAAAVAAGTTLLGVVDPAEPGHYPACPILAVTGLYCPGCGGLRAVPALTAGDVRQALDLNALFVVSVPFLVVGYLWWLRSRWRRRSAGRPAAAVPAPAAYWSGGVAFVLMLLFGVLRNLPAFAVLAP